MCGIAGIVSSEPVIPEEVRAMIDVLRHRGPDDAGLYADANVALGHRRLSILDLSPLGHQPMLTSDGRFCIVFNGEIYNFREIRDDLASKGHSFRSRTDTEVVLAAYREFGLDCLERLRGMFAFAIWDGNEKRLFLARDRLGKKPLYFFADGRRLAFASDIPALLRVPWISRELDYGALNSYFSLQYVPGPRTAFRAIRKLPPGHFLFTGDVGRSWWMQRYWTPPEAGEDGHPGLDEQRFEELLRKAVRLRLIADVDVGVLLSGGIDSSLITAIAAEQGGNRLCTFSVGFRDETLNELPHARRIASEFGTDHHEMVVDDVGPEVVDEIVEHMDEPLADPACIPTFLISRFAARHVKVVLSGEGADELFAGYRHYRWESLLGAATRLPVGPRRSLARVLATKRVASKVFFADRLAKVLESNPEAGAARWTTVFGSADRLRYLNADFRQSIAKEDPLEAIHDAFREQSSADRLARSLNVDLQTWLPDDLLMKVDRMTMACSLEARTPFLDHEFVEEAAACGTSAKMRGAKTKLLLRRVAARRLPQDIVGRRKHGFEVPLRRWLIENFRDSVEEAFAERHLKEGGVLDPAGVRRAWREFVEDERAVSVRKIWSMFCFARWDLRIRRGTRGTGSRSLFDRFAEAMRA